jgi:hypothetical protein
MWTDSLLRLRALLFRRQMDNELQDELQFHLEMQARKNQQSYLAPDEANRQATRIRAPGPMFGGKVHTP